MRKLAIVVAATALALTGCSNATTDAESPQASNAEASQEATTSPAEQVKKLVVVSHDSFNLSDELKAKFAEQTGYEVTYLAPGDAGTLVNQLVLTKDAPLGDVVFGIDNTFAGRAQAEGVLAPYTSSALPASAAAFETTDLTPIDFGDVCLNADKNWFAEKGLEIPAGYDDLLDPKYKDLLVVSHPASSSPGLAFLLATIANKGADGYLDYWRQLKDNGVKVVPGWTDAYFTEFSAADGKGPRPLVLSYATSPAFTVAEDGSSSSTVALLDTCFRQVEYAGVLRGANNPEGAKAFIDFLLSDEVQASFPESMYMYPVNTEVALPEQWQQFAPLADNPGMVDPAYINENRDGWIQAWTDAVIG